MTADLIEGDSESATSPPVLPDTTLRWARRALTFCGSSLTSGDLRLAGKEWTRSFSDLSTDSLCSRMAQLEIDSIRHQAELAELRKERNRRCAATYNLPFELLGECLLQSLDESTWSVARLKQLATVGCYWWRVVKLYPRLWGVVRRDPSTTLTLSGTVPLAIQYYTVWPTQKATMDFVRLVKEHAHRIRSLKFHSQHLGAINLILKDQLPLLEAVELRAVWSCRISFAGGPRLRRVRPEWAVVDWCGGCLFNLTHLTISHISRAAMLPTVSQLVIIISSCPHLQELCLDDFVPIRPDDLPDSELKAISLPSLRTLSLRTIPIDIASSVLRIIQPAALSRLEIVVQDRRGISALCRRLSASEAGISFLSQVVKHGGISHVTVTLEQRSLRVRSAAKGFEDHPPLDIRLLLDGWGRLADPGWVSILLGGVDVTVDLTLHQDVEPTSFFKALPKLCTLKLTDIEDGILHAPSILHYLSRPHTNQDGRKAWPCPELAELKILRPWPLADIDQKAQLVETQRCRAAANADVAGGINAPVAMRLNIQTDFGYSDEDSE